MTDLFAQQGIDFQSSQMAGTHPSASPDPISAPKISMPPEQDDLSAPGTPAPQAPTSNQSGLMTQQDKQKAILDIFTADADQGEPSAAPSASNPAPVARDLFKEQGINAPTVTDVNQNAFSSGVPVKTPDPVTDNGTSWAPVSRAEMSQPDYGQPNTEFAQARKQVQDAAAHDDAQMQQLIQTRMTPAEVQALKDKGPIGFSEAFSQLHANQVLPGGGVSQLYNSMDLVHIVSKMKAGEPITPDDQGKLNAFLQEQMEQKIRGFSWGGNTAYIGSQIPAFVVEFALSDGVGKMAQTAVREAVQDATARSAVSAVTGIAARAATTTSLMVPQYTARYGERRLNDISSVTDKGQLVLQDSTESPAKSALMAWAHTGADVAAQIAAPGIGKFVIDPAKKLVSTPMIAAANQLPAAVKDGLYQAYKLIEPNATVSKVFSSAGWAGMLEQLGANRIAQVLHATLDLGTNPNMTFDKYLDAITPSKDQLLVEGGLVGITGGIHTSSSIAFNLLRSKGMSVPQANESVENMSALEKDNFVNDHLPTPKSEFPKLPTTFDFSDLPKVKLPTLDSADAEKYPFVEKPTQAVVHHDVIDEPPEQSILKGQSASNEQVAPPPIHDEQSNFNSSWKDFVKPYAKQTYAALFNDLQPIEDLTKTAETQGATIPAGESPALLASITRMTPEWIKRNIQENTTTWDSEGNQVSTGKGLKPIMDDFDNMFLTTEGDRDTRRADLEKFLVAERFLEEKQNSGKTGAMVTDEQVQKSAKDMHDLSDKYGDNFRFFGTFADEIREWDNRILHNLVSSGLWTQERYDETVNSRSKYSPLQRVMDEENSGQPGVTAKNVLGKDVTPSRIGSLKQFKGSTREVKNTFNSRMRNAALILQNSMVNHLRVSMAKYAEYYPDQVKIENPAIIQKEVKTSYDPKLRARLESAIQAFGGKMERTDSLGKKNLGEYHTMENLIKLRLGTGEGTLTHEVGHMLDEKLGLGDKLLKDPKIKTELQNLAEDRIGLKNLALEKMEDGTHFREELGKSTAKYREYIKNDAEVIANMYDAYVNSPDQMKEIAPRAFKAFEKIIDKNLDLAFLKEIKPSTNRAMETIQQARRDMVGPKDSLPVYIDGQRKYMVMSKDLAKAMLNLKPIEHTFVEKFIGGVFRGSTRLLRFGATNYPAFVLRHGIRSFYTSFLNTKGRATPENIFKHFFVAMPKAMFNVMSKSELYKDWKTSSGGFNTYMDLSDKGLDKLYKDTFNEKSPLRFFNPANWLHVMKDVGDQSARVAVFDKAKASGKSDLEAGILSLEATGNYGRHGSLSKRVNQYAPFFNDMMQGGDRAVRSMMRDPAGFTMRALATITAPQVLITGYYLYAADDKTRDEYLNFPEWSKGAFMHIKIGGQWVPIPRPFSPGFIFGGLPEKIMIHMYKGYHPEVKNFWLNTLSESASSVSPVFDWTRAMTPVVKSYMESVTNYSFFRDRPIYYQDKNKTLPQDRYNQFTSETGKLVGKTFGFSPAVFDNTVEDMSAQIGKYALQLSDAGIKAARRAEGQQVAGRPARASDNPLIGKFLADTPTGTQTQSYAEFKEHLSDATQTKGHLKQVSGTQEGAQYQQEQARTLAAYPGIHGADKQINGLLKQVKMLNANTNIPVEEKGKIEQNLNDQINRIAESANIGFRQAIGQQQ